MCIYCAFSQESTVILLHVTQFLLKSLLCGQIKLIHLSKCDRVRLHHTETSVLLRPIHRRSAAVAAVRPSVRFVCIFRVDTRSSVKLFKYIFSQHQRDENNWPKM